MELKAPDLTRVTTKALNMPIVKNRTRLESFCENCRQQSIKWGFCYICGLEVK